MHAVWAAASVQLCCGRQCARSVVLFVSDLMPVQVQKLASARVLARILALHSYVDAVIISDANMCNMMIMKVTGTGRDTWLPML